jgi:hypothetical protein
MAHTWWHIGDEPDTEEELYARWAALRGDESFRGGGWLGNILGQRARYSGDPEADAYVAALREEMAGRPEQAGVDMPMGVSQEEAAYAGLPSTGGIYDKDIDITPQEAVEKLIPKKEKKKKTSSDLERLFLYDLLSQMHGGDAGQAPAVVAGGGRREFPSMMRQFAPWEREKPYWWLRA